MPRDPKVFLVNPTNSEHGGPGLSFITPRWLPVIAAATPQDPFGDPVLTDETIRKFDPSNVQKGDIVGVGITTGNCWGGYQVVRKAKEKGATVIVGGIHATIFPEEPLKFGADAVITGNGDSAWTMAATDALNGRLQRLYNGGQIPGDQMLEARWDLMEMDKYLFPTVQTVAGCPENCSFCSVWVTDGRRPRQRLSDKIINEVNTLYKMGFRFIVFADDNFNPATVARIEREESMSKKKELERIMWERYEFFEEYDRRVPKDIYAFTQMTSEVAKDEKYLSAMHDKARIRAALIGVESFNEPGLKSANKTWNPVGQEMVNVIRTIEDQGICVLASIICGLETDTPESLETMGEFARQSGATLAQFAMYYPYPGTKDWHEMLQDKKRREDMANPLRMAPKHQVQVLYDQFWLDPDKPVVSIKHPNMDAKTLVAKTKQNWDMFYNWVQLVCMAARKKRWPIYGRLIYIFGARVFRSVYGGYGASADSVRNRKMSRLNKFLFRLAFYMNSRFLKKEAVC